MLAVLGEPAQEMRAVRGLLSERERFLSRQIFGRCSKICRRHCKLCPRSHGRCPGSIPEQQKYREGDLCLWSRSAYAHPTGIPISWELVGAHGNERHVLGLLRIGGGSKKGGRCAELLPSPSKSIDKKGRRHRTSVDCRPGTPPRCIGRTTDEKGSVG